MTISCESCKCPVPSGWSNCIPCGLTGMDREYRARSRIRDAVRMELSQCDPLTWFCWAILVDLHERGTILSEQAEFSGSS